jgi:YesN/AraC family two-component response regulator
MSGREGACIMRVLLVDDEKLAIDRLRTFFSDIEGVELVGEARDGNEAVEQIRALTPDLVIMDIQMPGRTGLKAARDRNWSSSPPTNIMRPTRSRSRRPIIC